MSKENEKTIEVYEKYGAAYLERDKDALANNPKAQADDVYQRKILAQYMEGLPKDAKIFEVGSGSGRDATRLRELGFTNIVVSDVADFFLEHLRTQGFNPVKFNLISDDFTKKYDFILCWAVLVHFTKEEARAAIVKMYEALSSGGRLAFCVESKVKSDPADGASAPVAADGEWADFKGKIGAKRYFSYWTLEEVREFCDNLGLRALNLSERTGARASWIEYCGVKE